MARTISNNNQTCFTAGPLGTDGEMSDPVALKDRVRDINQRGRRARVSGQITVTELSALLVDTKAHCPRCGKRFGPMFHDRWVVCFEVPLSIGGECTRDNTMIVCRDCEMRRALEMGVTWPGSRRRSGRRSRTVATLPSSVYSSRSLPVMFIEEEAY